MRQEHVSPPARAYCRLSLRAPINPQNLSGRFVTYRKSAKVPTGSLHTLRHTAATLMLTSGVPIHVVAARLGDRSETIPKTYAHLLPQSDEAAAVGMAELLAGAH